MIFFNIEIRMWNNAKTIDTLQITSRNQDTTEFMYLEDQYTKIGDRIWIHGDSGMVFLYDYSLSKGDSFRIYMEYRDSVLLIVDSVRSVTFIDGTERRMWHLKRTDVNDHIVWIEGLGAEGYGWDYTWMDWLDHGRPSPSAICHHGDVKYWDSTIKTSLKPEYRNSPLVPTCDFEDLLQKLSSPGKPVIGVISIQPNPANSSLQVTMDEGEYFKILDHLGREVMRGDYTGSVDISELPSGIYFIEVSGAGLVRRGKFLKN